MNKKQAVSRNLDSVYMTVGFLFLAGIIVAATTMLVPKLYNPPVEKEPTEITETTEDTETTEITPSDTSENSSLLDKAIEHGVLDRIIEGNRSRGR